MLHVHITLQSREFSIQNPILHTEDKELFECYYYITEGKETFIPVIHDLPASPGNSTMFQEIHAIPAFLRLECIFYSSIGFHRKLHRVPVGHLQTLQTFIHSSKKGRCCDIGQIDRFSIIELFPLSSCQVIILIARMTFNCSTSCLMS